MKEFSAKTMKIFHECWIFHALFVTIGRRYIIVAKGMETIVGIGN